jgi:nucleolar pre-ribosomal-associated protein 1
MVATLPLGSFRPRIAYHDDLDPNSSRSGLKLIPDVTQADLSSLEGAVKDICIGGNALESILSVPATRDQNNSILSNWASKTVDELVDEGYAAKLISLLGSEHMSIRKEALTNILKMAAKVQQSDYDEKEQVWLLLSELAETARDQIDNAPLPSPAIAFASHAVQVLRDPLHRLYAKVNAFLTRGPTWPLDNFPVVNYILLEEPSADDTYYSEVTWLLAYLLDSLRTPLDMGLFHKRRLFERLLSLAGNPFMRPSLKTDILKIVYRATCIDGGSTTLTTRFGIVSWLEAQRSCCTSDSEAGTYAGLVSRIWETCDQERVTLWSKDGVKSALET